MNHRNRLKLVMVRVAGKSFQTFVFVLIVCLTANGGFGPLISVPPVDTVGCYGGISTFYCESKRNDVSVYIYWTLNSHIITDKVAKLRGISFNSNGVGNSSLNIIGSEDNNGVTIQCGAASPPHFESRSALFTVSDIPPVTNLTITFTNNGTMNCTWIQPSCLPVNYSYSISINNVSVTNTTSTVYSTSNIESCTNYTVSVTVTDTTVQYQSIATIETALSGFYLNLKVNNLHQTTVLFHDEVNRFVNIKFESTSNVPELLLNCRPLGLDFYNEIIPPEYSQLENDLVNVYFPSYDESTGIGNYTIGPFNESFIGYYLLHTRDEKEIASTNISTFHVQDAAITQLSNGTTLMECSFAYNSPADGCQFELISAETGNTTLRNITKDENEDTATLYTDLDIPEGEYDVQVYDIVDGDIAAMSAINRSYQHTVPSDAPDGNSSTSMIPTSITSTSMISSKTSTSMISSKTLSTLVTITSSISPTRGNDTLSNNLILGIGVVFAIFVIIIFVLLISIFFLREHKRKQLSLNSEKARSQMPIAESNEYMMMQVQQPAQTEKPTTKEINDYIKDPSEATEDSSSTGEDTVLPDLTAVAPDTCQSSTKSFNLTSCVEAKLEIESNQVENIETHDDLSSDAYSVDPLSNSKTSVDCGIDYIVVPLCSSSKDSLSFLGGCNNDFLMFAYSTSISDIAGPSHVETTASKQVCTEQTIDKQGLLVFSNFNVKNSSMSKTLVKTIVDDQEDDEKAVSNEQLFIHYNEDSNEYG